MSSWMNEAAVQNHNGNGFPHINNPNAPPVGVGNGMMDPAAFMAANQAQFNPVAGNPYASPQQLMMQQQQQVQQQAQQQGGARNASPSAFQNPMYQTNSVIPSKRPRPREDSMAASPRQNSGMLPTTRAETPGQQGQPGQPGGPQSTPQPPSFPHNLPPNGSANATPSPIMANQIRAGSAVPQRVATTSPHPFSPATQSFVPQASPAPSDPNTAPNQQQQQSPYGQPGGGNFPPGFNPNFTPTPPPGQQRPSPNPQQAGGQMMPQHMGQMPPQMGGMGQMNPQQMGQMGGPGGAMGQMNPMAAQMGQVPNANMFTPQMQQQLAQARNPLEQQKLMYQMQLQRQLQQGQMQGGGPQMPGQSITAQQRNMIARQQQQQQQAQQQAQQAQQQQQQQQQQHQQQPGQQPPQQQQQQPGGPNGQIAPNTPKTAQGPGGAPGQQPNGPQRSSDQFMNQLSMFMQRINMPLETNPVAGDRPMHLMQLFQTVQKFSGYRNVMQNNVWPQVSNALGFPPAQIPTVAGQIKAIYERNLLKFEDFVVNQSRAKANMQQQQQLQAQAQAQAQHQAQMKAQQGFPQQPGQQPPQPGQQPPGPPGPPGPPQQQQQQPPQQPPQAIQPPTPQQQQPPTPSLDQGGPVGMPSTPKSASRPNKRSASGQQPAALKHAASNGQMNGFSTPHPPGQQPAPPTTSRKGKGKNARSASSSHEAFPPPSPAQPGMPGMPGPPFMDGHGHPANGFVPMPGQFPPGQMPPGHMQGGFMPGHMQGPPFGDTDEYKPCSRDTHTYGGVDVNAPTNVVTDILRFRPEVPAPNELGNIDVHALTMSIQSGIHGEVRLALDTLATVTVTNMPGLEIDLDKCDDLLETLIEYADELLEVLAENTVEVSDEILIPPYEDIARACQIERLSIRDEPELGSEEGELDRAVEYLLCITTIFRNLSFNPRNQAGLADESAVKFLCQFIRYVGTRNMLLRTQLNMLDFMKDIITLLSNISGSIEIPDQQEAFCFLQFLLAFAPSPLPSLADEYIFFPTYHATLQPYLPSAVDALAKLLARDEPNRTHFRNVFAADPSGAMPFDLLTQTFALAISPIPDYIHLREMRPPRLPPVQEVRKPMLMQGLLAADIVASLAPGFETGVTRTWLTAQNGFVQNLHRTVRDLCRDYEMVEHQLRHFRGRDTRGLQKDAEIMYIVVLAVSMLRKLSEKAIDPADPKTSLPPSVLPSEQGLLEALEMLSGEWSRDGFLHNFVAFASLGEK
ncbi:component of SWI/SNF global activator complex [Sporothrix stenoceras]|uniref:Component of SWI/SNF global activator complex n=1 Tax=Sporothrix stenoceras TaxID=5173 RepID=A0ABR3YVN1_9PEZI